MTPERYARATELFLAACKLPIAARAVFVSGACGSDRALLDQVNQMLREEQSTSSFLDNPALGEGVAAEMAERAGASFVDPWLGKRIGRFLIQRRIDTGGMGVVYLAEQDDPKRSVALKLIRDGADSARAASRFNDEIRLMGTLHHEGIAQLFEAGTHLDGAVPVRFFAMEYIAGAKTITDHAVGRQRPETLGRFARVCDAVAHAHALGIIHRDLKPDNILVGDDGKTKVIDFGVARAVGGDAMAATRATEAGALTGTLQYMSPEQYLGGHVDRRSDVYALGLILYELLTGRRPYDLKGASPATAAWLITEQTPTSPGKLDSALRGDLETIVLEALHKQPDRRYQSAEALAADVRAYLTLRPIQAKLDSRWYRFKMFRRRNRAVVRLTVGLLVALTVGFIGTSYGFVRANVMRDRAQAVTEYLFKGLESLKPSGRVARDMTAPGIMMRIGAGLDQSELSDQPATKARLLRTISGGLDDNGKHEDAENRARQALAIEEELHHGDHADRVTSLQCLANVLIGGSSEKKAEAVRRFQEALDMNMRLYPGNHREVAASLGAHANACLRVGQEDEAEKQQKRALEMYIALYPGDHPAVGSNLYFLGYMIEKRSERRQDKAERRKDQEEAETLYVRSLEMRRRLIKAEHPDVAAVLAEYGVDRSKLQPDDDPGVASTLNSLGWVRHSLGRDDEAEDAFTQALNINRHLGGDGKFGVAHPLTAFADHLLRECPNHDFARAEKLYRKVLEIQEGAYGRDHEDRARTMADLARCQARLGRFSEAHEAAQEAVAMAIRIHQSKGDDTRKYCDDALAEIKENSAGVGAVPR